MITLYNCIIDLIIQAAGYNTGCFFSEIVISLDSWILFALLTGYLLQKYSAILNWCLACFQRMLSPLVHMKKLENY
jgi:hypothetical protein